MHAEGGRRLPGVLGELHLGPAELVHLDALHALLPRPALPKDLQGSQPVDGRRDLHPPRPGGQG